MQCGPKAHSNDGTGCTSVLQQHDLGHIPKSCSTFQLSMSSVLELCTKQGEANGYACPSAKHGNSMAAQAHGCSKTGSDGDQIILVTTSDCGMSVQSSHRPWNTFADGDMECKSREYGQPSRLRKVRDHGPAQMCQIDLAVLHGLYHHSWW